ncbi:MAG: hypothetical protein ABSF29_05660 [Tepidisphaeraceae bacterium]
MITDQINAIVRELVPLQFVDDIQLCAAFYVDKLGFAMEQKFEPAGKLVWCKPRRKSPASQD